MDLNAGSLRARCCYGIRPLQTNPRSEQACKTRLCLAACVSCASCFNIYIYIYMYISPTTGRTVEIQMLKDILKLVSAAEQSEAESESDGPDGGPEAGPDSGAEVEETTQASAADGQPQHWRAWSRRGGRIRRRSA